MADLNALTPEERLRIIKQPRRAHSASITVFPDQVEHSIEDIANELNPKRHDIRDRQKRNR